MEITTVNSFLDYYKRIRERTNKLIEIIPHEHFDFAYRKGKFTIADQIRHIATIERYMFAETIAGRKSSYHGCGKNLADGPENVVNYFHELHRQSIEIFSSISNEDLQRKCTTPGDAKMVI